MNYIKIINWFWDEVPYMDGFKAAHAALFFAIVDSINRNNWAANTPIAYDRLINKVKFSKQVYLDGRDWLTENKIIEMVPGKNHYQMAVFNLGVAVRNQTANLTANLTADDTSNLTATRPLTLPIIKQVNNKNNKTNKQVNNTIASLEINIPFKFFYDLYDMKVGGKKSEALWIKLSGEERELAISHIPKYKISTPDKSYRKHPATYLINKSFNDEIIIQDERKNGFNTHERNNPKRNGVAIAADRFFESISELEQ